MFIPHIEPNRASRISYTGSIHFAANEILDYKLEKKQKKIIYLAWSTILIF